MGRMRGNHKDGAQVVVRESVRLHRSPRIHCCQTSPTNHRARWSKSRDAGPVTSAREFHRAKRDADAGRENAHCGYYDCLPLPSSLTC